MSARGSLGDIYGLVTSSTNMALSLKRSAAQKLNEQLKLREVSQMLDAEYAEMGVPRDLMGSMVSSQRKARSVGRLSSHFYDGRYPASASAAAA